MKKFEYEGKEISFDLTNENVMVNATEMAKPFGKTPWKWLELPSTKKFISTMSDFRSLAENELVTSVRGGVNIEERGNWFHEDVAIEFARWLHPAFAIWCNDRIKELMKHGATAINPDDFLNPDFVINIMVNLKREREEKRILEEQNKQLQKPALIAKKLVHNTEDETYSWSEVAKILNLEYNTKVFGRNNLMKLLRDNKILDKNSIPYQQYMVRNYFVVKENFIHKINQFRLNTRVTKKGLIWLQMNNEKILSKIQTV